MTCPVCGKATDQQLRPFCSRRCADVDLGRWLNESYRIPAEPAEPSETDDADDGEADPKPH